MATVPNRPIRVAAVGCGAQIYRRVGDLPEVHVEIVDETAPMHGYDVALVDVRNGHLYRLRPWRDHATTPVLAVCGSLEDAVASAQAGAADVLVAPVQPSELQARLAMATCTPALDRMPIGPHVVDLVQGVVETPDGLVDLSPSETAVARLLLRNPGIYLTSDYLQEHALGYRPGSRSRAGSQVFYRLRKKVEPNPDEPRYFRSTYGKGFCFRPPEDADAVALSNLPALGVELVGRAEVLQELTLAVTQRDIVLVGPGGVGKTELALAVARRQSAASWPGGIWLVSLRGCADEALLIDAFCEALGLEVTGQDVLHAIEQRARSLFVFDELEEVGDDGARTLVRLASAHRVLATTRAGVDLGWDEVHLQPLDVADAVKLFRTRATQARFGRPLPDSDETVRALIAHADRLPLQVELLAAECRVRPVAAIRAELADTGALGMDDVVQRSWNLLSDHGRSALSTLLACHGGFRWDTAEDMVGADLLRDLAAASLLDTRYGDRMRLLAPVRRFVKRTRPANDVDRHRHAAWFARWSAEQIGRLWTSAHQATLADVLAERSNLLAAASWAREHGQADLWTPLVVALDHALELREHGHTRLARLALLPGVEGTPQLQLRRLAILVKLHREGESSALIERLEHRPLTMAQRVVLCCEASRLHEHTSLDGAARWAAKAVAVADDGTVSRALSLERHANVQRLLGSHDEASAALDDAFRVPDLPLAVRVRLLDIQGSLARTQGRQKDATQSFRELLAVAQFLGGTRLAHAAYHLGSSLLVDGDVVGAEKQWRTARNAGLACGDASVTLRAQLGLAVLHLDAGRPENAYREAMSVVAAGIHEGTVRASCFTLVSLCLRHLDRTREALHWLQTAHAIAVELGNPETLGFVGGHLAGALADLGRSTEAALQLDAARDVLVGSGVSGGDEFLSVVDAHLHLARQPTDGGTWRRVVRLARHAKEYGEDEEIRRAAALLSVVASRTASFDGRLEHS